MTDGNRELVATKPLKYGTRRLLPGDVFEAKKKDAKLLVAIKKARPTTGEGRVATALKKPPASLASAVTASQNTEEKPTRRRRFKRKAVEATPKAETPETVTVPEIKEAPAPAPAPEKE